MQIPPRQPYASGTCQPDGQRERFLAVSSSRRSVWYIVRVHLVDAVWFGEREREKGIVCVMGLGKYG